MKAEARRCVQRERASKRGLKAAFSKGSYMTSQSRLPDLGVGVDDEPPIVVEPAPAAQATVPNARKLGRRELDESIV